MEPASFLRVRLSFVCALVIVMFFGAYLASPAVRHTALEIVQIVWLYFVTGTRG